jgi:hypothetical protein
VLDHQPVALEIQSIRLGHPLGKPAAAHGRKGMRQPQPGDMQSSAIQPLAADDRIVEKRLCPGSQL